MERGKGWLRATGNRVAEMRGPMGKIRAGSLRYSEDGTFIVAPARDVKTVWVWDAATLERCRAFEGDNVESLPETLRVREPVPERMKVSRRNAETVVVDESTGKEIAWFALPFYEVTPHPGGRTWAGRSDDVHAHMNTARRLDLFDLEGRLPPETPRWKGSAIRE
jgi:hypothetical protein